MSGDNSIRDQSHKSEKIARIFLHYPALFLFFYFINTAHVYSSNVNHGEKSINDSAPVFELKTGWQYRIGDSPTDSSGRLIWLDAGPDSAQWTTVNSLNEILTERTINSLWLRIQLPDWHGLCPGLFTGRVDQVMQVYLEDELIYQFGDFLSINDNHFQGWRHHLVPLPDNFANRMLTIRIWSNGSITGIETPILLGSVYEIQRNQFISDIDDIILGSLFLLFAIVLIFLFFFIRRDPLIIKIALYLIAIGSFIISNSSLLKTLIYAPYLFFLIDIISMFSIPIAGYLLIENVMLVKYKTIIRRLWQIQLLYLIISMIVLQFSTKIYIYLLVDLFLIIGSILMVVCAGLIFKIRKQIGTEIKILLAGFIIIFITTSIELILFYITYIKSGETFQLSLFPYGALFFVACLVWIIINRFIETNRQKIVAQKEAMESVIQSERLKSQIIRKQLETEKWQELDKLKSRFLANISHEFRTPLTLILGTAHQLISENHNELVTERSRMQEKSGRQLLRQVNQLLDLSKLDAGKMKLQAEEKDIIPLIKGIFHSFESFAKQREIELVFKSETELVKIFYDFDKMETILSNLFSNAVKFTPAGGQVEVTVSQKKRLEIRVADTGPGISQEHLPHIFDRFYQAGSSDARDQKGSGIGLALTRELVRLHHGEIKVTCEENKGAVFTVYLPMGKAHLKETEIKKAEDTPLLEADNGAGTQSEMQDVDNPLIKTEKSPSASEAVSDLPSTDSGAENPILLIVEDNEDMRNYIREVLSDVYRVEEATDGEQGFTNAAKDRHLNNLPIC